VTIVFPATAEEAVSAFSLDGTVQAPVKGATPDATAIDETQYTGSIAWQTSGGVAHTGAFAAATVYQAVVTLTANTGWTFTGVGAGSFTYTGATVTNAADSGTVTITFPATAEEDPNIGIPIGSPSVKLYRDGGTTPLEQNGNTAISSGAGIFTVSIDEGSYSAISWTVNGNSAGQAQGKTSIALPKHTAGTYLITVEATPQGGAKQSGAHTFTVE
jgi:hypothetical protein